MTHFQIGPSFTAMPRNQDKKLLFIHIPKNAGKFIEDRYRLSSKPGQEDNQVNRSLLSNAARVFIKLDKKRQAKAVDSLTSVIDIGLTAQHLTLAEMQLFGFVGKELNSLKLLTSVRHPYTRMKSIYCHIRPQAQRSQEDFEHFAEKWPSDISPSMRHNILAFKRSQVDFLRGLNGKIPTNLFIARVENLESDLHNFEHQSSLNPRPEASLVSPLPSAHKHGSGAKDNHLLPGGGLRISAAISSAVSHYYSDDFDILGYSKLSPQEFA